MEATLWLLQYPLAALSHMGKNNPTIYLQGRWRWKEKEIRTIFLHWSTQTIIGIFNCNICIHSTSQTLTYWLLKFQRITSAWFDYLNYFADLMYLSNMEWWSMKYFIITLLCLSIKIYDYFSMILRSSYKFSLYPASDHYDYRKVTMHIVKVSILIRLLLFMLAKKYIYAIYGVTQLLNT